MGWILWKFIFEIEFVISRTMQNELFFFFTMNDTYVVSQND